HRGAECTVRYLQIGVRYLQVGVRFCQLRRITGVAFMQCGMCQGGAGLLGQDGQQLDLIVRRCTGGTDHHTPVDDASVTQRERPPPPAVSCVHVAIPAGLAVPLDVGVCRLGWWKGNESAVHRPVTSLGLARCADAQYTDRSPASTWQDASASAAAVAARKISPTSESSKVTRDRAAKPPGEACSAGRVACAGLCDSSFMLERPDSGSLLSSHRGRRGPLRRHRGTAYPNVELRNAFPGPKVPTRRPLIRPYSAVVLTGRIRVQIFGSPGARDVRYALPDSLFGSELRRTLQRVRCRPPLSALP